MCMTSIICQQISRAFLGGRITNELMYESLLGSQGCRQDGLVNVHIRASGPDIMHFDSECTILPFMTALLATATLDNCVVHASDRQ